MFSAISLFISANGAKLKLAAAIATVAAAFAFGWVANGWRCDASRVDAINAAIAAHIEAQKESNAIGIDLENGLNQYRPAAKQLDDEVQNATVNDTGNRFDANSVQRTASRIAAGDAARKRANGVR